MATRVTSMTFYTTGSSNLRVQVRNAATGAVIQARTATGIREDVTSSGIYCYSASLADVSAYEIIWDAGGASFDAVTSTGEIFTPTSITVSGTAVTPLPVVGDDNGTLLGTTFLIKRNDTKPYLRRQLVDTNGSVVTLGTADTVMFTMRPSSDVAMAGTAKVHGTAVIIDASQGIIEYRWATGDTDTTTWVTANELGRATDTPYAAEFEVTSISDGRIETFPQGGFIAVSIPPDLDPGVNP